MQPSLEQIARQYEACFPPPWNAETPIDGVRFVVLDTETTGTDPRRDKIITIGAVAVLAGDILLNDSFEAMLHIPYNMSSVKVHGITRDQAREGLTETEALEQFLPYLGNGVIVGHHIGHDVQALDIACRRSLNVPLLNQSMDTMDLALHLERDGAFGEHRFQSFTLDALCDYFSIRTHDRHTAGGDALLTAYVLLRLLRRATRVNRLTLGSIAEPFPHE
ncbi:MAG: 3'-5' exonuclease [Bryobacteraceae bacterium]